MVALRAARRCSFVIPSVGLYRDGSRDVRSWIEDGFCVVNGEGRWIARARLGLNG